LKTSLILTFLLLSNASSAASAEEIITGIFVNGESVMLEKNKLNLVDKDDLLLFLKPLPKGRYYTYSFNSCRVVRQIDSTHFHFYSFKKGDNDSLVIRVLPQHKSYPDRTIQISVRSAVFESWRFVPLFVSYLLLLLGIALAGVIFFNNRNRKKVFNQRSDWTNQLHNDIGGDLSSVALRLEILRKKMADVDEKTFANLSKIFNILSDIQTKLRFVFNLVDPKQDSLQVMFMGIHDFAHDNCALQHIRFFYNNDIDNSQGIKIDIGRINKIYLVLKEALNNVFKSANASTLSLTIQRKKEGIWIELEDDGIGFDPQKIHKGNGIKNLRQYAQEGLMELKIHSDLGKGTRITALIHLL